MQVTGSALAFAGTYRWWEDAVKSWCDVDFFLCISNGHSLTIQFRKPQLTVDKVCLLKFKFCGNSVTRKDNLFLYLLNKMVEDVSNCRPPAVGVRGPETTLPARQVGSVTEGVSDHMSPDLNFSPGTTTCFQKSQPSMSVSSCTHRTNMLIFSPQMVWMKVRFSRS